jgi:hypothetical protein
MSRFIAPARRSLARRPQKMEEAQNSDSYRRMHETTRKKAAPFLFFSGVGRSTNIHQQRQTDEVLDSKQTIITSKDERPITSFALLESFSKKNSKDTAPITLYTPCRIPVTTMKKIATIATSLLNTRNNLMMEKLPPLCSMNRLLRPPLRKYTVTQT